MTAHVAVLMGGPDAERDVSIASGTAVAESLERAGLAVQAVCIDRPAVHELEAIEADVFFPVLHGPWGEGGPLQELLESTGRPYVGSPPSAAATCMDKDATKHLARDMDIATPDWVVARTPGCPLDGPVVIKPVDDGSSIALTLCCTAEEAESAMCALIADRGAALVERWVRGRELTVGIVNDRALDIVESIAPDGVYDYAAKYHRDDTRYEMDPELDQTIAQRIQEDAVRLCAAAGVRDLARVDFMLDARGAWMLEVNTMPGFTTHSLLPMAAAHAGMDMSKLCRVLVDAALERVTADVERPPGS